MPVVCPNCHNHVYLHEIQSSKQVSLYFVPMASYGSDVYLSCPICHHGLQVGPGHRSAVDAMVQATRMVRTGQLAPEAYQMHAERFLTQMGLAAPQVPLAPPPTGGATVAHPASTVTSGQATSGQSVADKIASLARLKADGILTDEEFGRQATSARSGYRLTR